jgi:hypothetical protein
MTAEREFSWEPPAESGRQWIEIELDHPVNPWEHDGAGSISWGAHLDRSAPLGEEAVSIIKEACEQRGKHPGLALAADAQPGRPRPHASSARSSRPPAPDATEIDPHALTKRRHLLKRRLRHECLLQ